MLPTGRSLQCIGRLGSILLIDFIYRLSNIFDLSSREKPKFDLYNFQHSFDENGALCSVDFISTPPLVNEVRALFDCSSVRLGKPCENICNRPLHAIACW